MRLAATRSSISVFRSACCAEACRIETGVMDAPKSSATVSTAAAFTTTRFMLPFLFFRTCDHDDAGVGRRRVDPGDVGLAALERESLVDVALVGDLVVVDRWRVREKHDASDPLG